MMNTCHRRPEAGNRHLAERHSNFCTTDKGKPIAANQNPLLQFVGLQKTLARAPTVPPNSSEA